MAVSLNGKTRDFPSLTPRDKAPKTSISSAKCGANTYPQEIRSISKNLSRNQKLPNN